MGKRAGGKRQAQICYDCEGIHLIFIDYTHILHALRLKDEAFSKHNVSIKLFEQNISSRGSIRWKASFVFFIIRFPFFLITSNFLKYGNSSFKASISSGKTLMMCRFELLETSFFCLLQLISLPCLLFSPLPVVCRTKVRAKQWSKFEKYWYEQTNFLIIRKFSIILGG